MLLAFKTFLKPRMLHFDPEISSSAHEFWTKEALLNLFME